MSSLSTEIDDSKTTFIDKILGEMKSVFNKNSAKTDTISDLGNAQESSDFVPKLEPKTECESDLLSDKCLAPINEAVIKLNNTKTGKSLVKGKSNTADELTEKTEEDEEIGEDNDDKPRIVLTFRTEKTKNTVSSNYGAEKDSVEESVSPGRRSLRIKANSPADEKYKEMAKNSEVETGLKRSARRRSKDCTESILQSAIARKEKSYNETTRPQRLTRKLKPTAKILANLEMCQKSAALKKQSDKIKISPTTERERFSYENVEKGSEQAIIESDLVNEPPAKIADQLHRRFKRKHRVHNLLKTPPKKSKIRVKDEEAIKESDDSDSNSFSSPLEVEVEKELIPKLEIKKSLRKSSSEDTEGGSKMFRRSSRKARNLEVEEHQDNVEISEPSLGSVADQENLTPDQPESSIVTNSGKELSRRKCLCQENSRVFINTENTAPGVITYCTALDMINERVIGCNNSVSGEVAMLRPSTRIPYVILCTVHKQRLLRHNCCPTCGLFCTQGQFTECKNTHHYHRDCAVIIEGVQYCPHCSSLSPEIDVEITMKCSKSPAFLPAQKIHYPSAKMSFQCSPPKADVGLAIKRPVSPPFIPSHELEFIKSIPLEKYTDDMFTTSDLYEAIKKIDYVMVATILKSGQLNLGEVVSNAEDGFSLLHSASQEGLLPIVHALIISGCELDVLDKDQNSPLMVAIQAFKNNVVKYLIKSGASTDLKGTDGMSALHLAAKYGNLEACELLLSAVPNNRSYINCTDDGGWTPLVWACEHGHVEVTKFLLQNGADPLLRDVEHNVALHWAAFSGSSYLLELLLNNGCEVNAVNAHGDSALHVSARQDQYNCVLILLARGATVHAINTTSETPLSCCISETSDCHIAISLNMQLQAITDNCAVNRRKTILTNDISRGKELNPVQCINAIDDESKPTDFVYITDNCVTSDVNLDRKITTLSYCNCEDRCTSSDCLCSNHSLRCWYNEEGKLVPEFNFADPPMIFECNPMCACNAITCNNRVIQHGLTQRFQLFRTLSKGWGIRSLRLIPQGAYVCEYVGEIISDLEADQREDDSYLFDLDNRDGETYCIDARRYGNLSRFINHSCEPNLLPVRVYINHQDLRFPRIAFFANKDIQANEELGFDYGEKFWIIKYKSFTCTCNNLGCKYSDSTIKTTLENYERRLLEEQEILQEL